MNLNEFKFNFKFNIFSLNKDKFKKQVSIGEEKIK